MSTAPKITVRKRSVTRQFELSEFKFTKQDIPQTSDERILKYRQDAWESYENLPFPTLKDEAWRRTDIRNLRTESFTLWQDKGDPVRSPDRFMDPITVGEERSGQLISGAVEDAHWITPELENAGVIFCDFQTAEKEYPDLLDRLIGQIVSPNEDKFTALAAALAHDGVLLYVPKNVTINDPIHSLYWGYGEDQAFFNHILVWVEEGAKVTFVHESASLVQNEQRQLLHDGIVELYVGKNARLNFVELQSWGKNVWSFTRERARVMADANLEWIFGAMGTHLTKNFSDIDLVEPGASARMSGFYFTSGDQHLDHDTQQNHLAPNTTSDLLYKGALMDESRSVWQGMIYVAPGAIGTDGYQANRNLILSKGSQADSIPGLEILADDVRCTHGATVGKIDEDEIFYLLSRGIPRKEAEQLIVMGFFAPIMARIPFEGVQNRFANAVKEKMADR